MFGYKKVYINGEMLDAVGKSRQDVICPATDEKVAQIAWAGAADAQAALESARAGFLYWSALSKEERSDWMLRLHDAFSTREEIIRKAVMYESGKTWEGAGEDFSTVVNALTFYSSEMLKQQDEFLPDGSNHFEHRITRVPIGVVAAFLAWNFPLLNLGFKLGPVLAAGCSLIIVPSFQTPLSAYMLGEVCAEINFPKGVISILCGPYDEVASTLLRSPITAGVTLIGSTATGVHLIRESATSIKRYSMELGGNAPVLVFEDADLEKAVDTVAALKFGNTGQICVAPNRIFVHESIAAEFTQRVFEKAKAVKIGFGKDSGATMGPLISRKARTKVESLVQDAVREGAEILYGGSIPKGFETTGSYYLPTVIRNVTPEMSIFKQEIFGPVVSLIEFIKEETVLRLANDTSAGLASYVFTQNPARIERLTHLLQFGEVQVNGFQYNIALPHIGIKQSGIGCDCSHYALEDYQALKRITIAAVH
jgi:succinate-semialdehyde dehydrogenase/glutarate-semialdehyde dehydrogenase